MSDDQRVERAKADLRRMKEEIAPYVKERDRRHFKTAGQWQDTRRAAAESTGRLQRAKPN